MADDWLQYRVAILRDLGPLNTPEVLQLNGLDWRVMVDLARYADDASIAFPALDTLVSHVGRDRKAVKGSLRKLTAIGFIRVLKQGGGRAAPTIRQLTHPKNRGRICPPFDGSTGVETGGESARKGGAICAQTGGESTPPNRPTEQTKEQQQQGDAAAGDSRLMSVLAAAGIPPAEAARLVGDLPDLSPRDVEYHAAQVSRRSGITNPAGLLITKLRSGERAPSPAPARKAPVPAAVLERREQVAEAIGRMSDERLAALRDQVLERAPRADKHLRDEDPRNASSDVAWRIVNLAEQSQTHQLAEVSA